MKTTDSGRRDQASASRRGVLAIGTALLGAALACTSASAGDPIPPQPRMGAPLQGLTEEQLDRFFNGRIVYDRQLQVDEGLGPVFNQTSCASCHNSPIGGPGTQSVTRFGASDKGGFSDLSIFGGSLLQAQTIDLDCQEVIPPEANVTSLRVTPGMLGFGLVEAIADEDILALESDPPGISGRAHIAPILETPGATGVGRFGWKAQLATILSFSADAAQNEMGLTNRILMEENDPNGIREPELADCDDVPDPEDNVELGNGVEFIDAVTDFQRFLAAPPQTPRSGMTGEMIFDSTGCTQCHTPQFTTRDDPALEDAIRNKVIRPYSDFLLHDMGIAADFIAQGEAQPREIRTTPLWNVRTRDPMWHDGRFGGGTFEERIRDSIAEHGAIGSEAQGVVADWNALSAGEQDAVIAFLDSLGRREFDHDGDDQVVFGDFLAFEACFFADGPYDADDPCAISDINQDGDVDEIDFGSFLLVYAGPMDDCNGNGVLDIIDIIEGDSLDADLDGVPDECGACLADVAGDDGEVDVQDLLALLAAWDTDGAGADIASPFDVVDVNDLLGLLSAWGPCP